MDKKLEQELYSEVLETLISHLQKRNLVKNMS